MSETLRILALVTDAFGGYGGIAQYNRDLLAALALSPRVAEIVVLPRVRGEGGEAPFEKIVQLGPSGSRACYGLRAARFALSRRRFDVVYCGHPYHAFLALTVARVCGARLWLQAHGIDAWTAPSRTVDYAFARADLVTAVSRYTRRRVLEWARLRAERVRVLPNTVRPMFAPGPRDEAALAKFGLRGRKVVLAVSRLNAVDSYKGHVRVIDALAALRDSEPAAAFAVVGDGDARAGLEAHAARSGLAQAVRFLGRLSDEDVRALYRSADIFCMPSTKEGFGIVFVEAAMCGLPVIAGDGDGSADALADGTIGRLVDPRSHADLVAALRDALRQRPAAPTHAARFAFPNFADHVEVLVAALAA